MHWLLQKTSDFKTNYPRIKENCSNYSGVEALGVSQLYHKYSYLSDSNIVVLDIEVSFQSFTDEKKQDRVDGLLYNRETQTLQFVEAKHYSNSEIRSKSKPEVIAQIKKYENQIAGKGADIKKAYSSYIRAPLKTYFFGPLFDTNLIQFFLKT